MSNPIRIRLVNSSYSGKLIGVTGTSTDGEEITGTYKSWCRAHEFDIDITGLYKLWVDPLGGTDWEEYSNWGGTNGKQLLGDEVDDHIEGHGSGANNKIATADIEDGAVTPAKTSFADDYV